ncbi:uncharacterized protein TNCV_5136431 [Trichonephila clavipes]|nr:uncharacterized protein TNCV_5136431 [Trichonephila clavipes]
MSRVRARCHEFEPSTTKDSPCRGAMHVKSVESSMWCGRRGGCRLMYRPRHLTMVQNYVIRRQKLSYAAQTESWLVTVAAQPKDPGSNPGEGMDVSKCIVSVRQDGATCHTARATIDLLKDTFGDRLISRFGPVNWPPRSCDLTPLDYFLWGYVKSLVYADKPQTLDHLEDNIRCVIADIRPQMLEKIIENWTSRLDYIRASHGSPMPEIIFKM